MNSIILMGRLTRDPDVRYSQATEPMAIANFSIAVDRRKRRNAGSDEPTADFFNVTAFGKLGEFVEKYLKQGTKIVVRGSLQNNHYTNKNGEKVYQEKIIAEEIQFAESKNSSDASASTPTANPAPATAPAAPAGMSSNGFMEIPDGLYEELPFK